MTTFSKAKGEVLECLAEMLEQYHGKLVELEVRVEVLIAWGAKNEMGLLTSPAIRINKVSAVGCIRVTSLKERVAGRGDAEMLVDGDALEDMEAATLAALIDHELTHLEIVEDNEGHAQSDDHGRPKLRTRAHDHTFGWFDAVARRHGAAAYEVMQATRLLSEPDNVQLYLPGFAVVESVKKRRKRA